MSGFITQLIETHRNIPVKEQVDAYFRLISQIQLAKDRNDMDLVVALSLKSLKFLEALIKETKKYSNSFDIITIPALEEGFLIAVVKGLRDQIENFKEVVSYYSELEPWKMKFETIEGVVGYIKAHSGCLQKDLKTIYPDIDPYLLAICPIRMEACGLIKRERTGNTFRLVYQSVAEPVKERNPSGTDITAPFTIRQKQEPRLGTKCLSDSIETANPPVISMRLQPFREDKYHSAQRDAYLSTYIEGRAFYEKGQYGKRNVSSKMRHSKQEFIVAPTHSPCGVG